MSINIKPAVNIELRLLYDFKGLEDPESQEEARLKVYFVIINNENYIYKISRRIDKVYASILKEERIGGDIPCTNIRYFIKEVTLNRAVLENRLIRKSIYGKTVKRDENLAMQGDIEETEEYVRKLMKEEVKQALKRY